MTEPAPRPPINWAFILPIATFVALAAALWMGLYLNPREIPSALIDKPVPRFALPPLPGRGDGLAAADLGRGKPVLLNVFASWCVPCRVEHPLLMALSREPGVTLVGLSYKDDPQAALAWLAQHGDPFQRIGMDRDGRVAIDFGVYGVPETFVITGDGRIAYKHVGPLDEITLRETLLPLIRRLAAKS
jgi:cytochrome c biogenesis protein CcmG/thiol:disulfide interchange protein DsbE